MDYKDFRIKALEPKPGKWRARAWCRGARPLSLARRKLQPFETTEDSVSAAEAMALAMEAIDAGAFSPPAAKRPGKFWDRAVRRFPIGIEQKQGK